MKTGEKIAAAAMGVAALYLLTRKGEAACTPNWQCESGNTGYEADGCGNRRLNDSCSANPVFNHINVDCNPCSIRVTQTSTITATAVDTAGNPVPNILIDWTSILGTVSPTSGTTNTSGITTTTFTAGNTTGTARVTATNTTSSITNYVDVTVTAAPVLTTLTITPPSATIETGASKNFIATCKDQYGDPMSGRTVNWSQYPTSLGTISPTSGTTGSDGKTTTTFTAGTLAWDITLTAQSGTLSTDAAITISATPATLCCIVISPELSNIAIDETVEITATCFDQNGVAIADDITATMSCPTLDWNRVIGSSYITITPIAGTNRATVKGIAVGQATITASNTATRDPACPTTC